MEREDVLLIGLYSVGKKQLTPVQVQKLFFLIDRNLAKAIGGRKFDFQPYNYGPFDKAVYSELFSMNQSGLVEIVTSGRWPTYQISDSGVLRAKPVFDKLDEKVRKYLLSIGKFVTETSFSELVSAIYEAYPEMRARSVFQD